MRILGIDTGWCDTGLAVVEWDGTAARLVEHHTITTKPTAKKLRLLVVDDHLRRLRELWHGVLRDGFVQQGVDVVALEALSLARNARSSARQAMAYAVAVCAAEQCRRPVAQFTPQQVRKNLGLPHNADKLGVASHVAAMIARSTCLLTEHESDACAVALACLYPEPIDLVRACDTKTRATVEWNTNIPGIHSWCFIEGDEQDATVFRVQCSKCLKVVTMKNGTPMNDYLKRNAGKCVRAAQGGNP